MKRNSCAGLLAAVLVVGNVFMLGPEGSALRLLGGLLLFCIVPGLALVNLVFDRTRQMELLPTFLLGVSMSFVLSTLIVLGLRLLPGGISIERLVLSIDVVSVALLTGGTLRARQAIGSIEVEDRKVWIHVIVLLTVFCFFQFVGLGFIELVGADEIPITMLANNIIVGKVSVLLDHIKGPAEVTTSLVFASFTNEYGEFALRFPLALASVISVLMLYQLGKEMLSAKVGFLGGLLLALGVCCLGRPRSAQYLDIVVLMGLAAVYCLWRALNDTHDRIRFIVLGSVFFAFGCLTHYGGIIVLPALAVLYLFRKPVSLKRDWFLWLACSAIVLVGGWFAAYRLAEPAWEINHHGSAMVEYPHNAANYLRFGLATRFGLVMDYGWVPPEGGFTYRIDYPPGASWMTALSYLIFGVHEWSTRLVPLLFSLGLVVLVFVLARRVAGNSWALLAAVFVAGSPAFLYYGRLPAPHWLSVSFALATFMLYREWVVSGKQKYLVGMWACFALGAWTGWLVYFVMPWVLAHYLLFHYRHSPNRRFLIVSLALPFVLFFLYVLWALAVAGLEHLPQLLEAFLGRTGTRGGSGFLTPRPLFQLSYEWLKVFMTPTLCILSLVWVISLVVRALKRKVTSDEFLVLCLFLYGLTHNLMFTNLAYVHDYVTVLGWIPFFALAGASGVRLITRAFFLRWRLVATVLLVPLVLFGFITQSRANVSGLHREHLEPDYYLAGIQINEAAPRDGKVMLSFAPDIFLNYYMDRPGKTVLTLDEFEALLEADPSYSHYVLEANDEGESEDLCRHLATNYPVQNYGGYAVFDLRETSIPSPENVVNVRFGDNLLLLGYDLEPEVLQAKEVASIWERHFNAHADWMPEHNAPFRVTYYWQALGPMDADYQVRSEFVADYDKEYAIDQTHLPVNGAYPTSMWQKGDIIRGEYVVSVPAGYPPLRYALRVSVIDAATGEPLPVEEAEGVLSDDGMQLALGYVALRPLELPVLEGDGDTFRMQGKAEQDLGNGLVFQGYDLADGSDGRWVSAGQTLRVGTFWRCNGPVGEDYPAWVELSDGEVRVRDLLGVEPTRLWEPGQYYERRGELTLSPYLLPGEYDLNLVLGQDREQRIALGTVEVGWAKNPNRIVDQMGVADGEKGDVRPLDTDRELRLHFTLDRPMELDVAAGWVGEALCNETWVDVYLENRYGERYLSTWAIPRGEHLVTRLSIPKKLISSGDNSIILRVPEDRSKPHYVGWRAWVDAVFPDMLYDLSGPHDGWIWADFVQVASEWREEWGAYRDLARVYRDLEMYDEVVDLFERAIDAGLRPDRLEDLNVFVEVFSELGASEQQEDVRGMVQSFVPYEVDVNFEDRVQLLGYSLERLGEGQGRFSLFFRSLRAMEDDYTVWLHQYGEGSEDFVSLDRLVETSAWQPGQAYEESWPVELGSGEVRFAFGFWRWEDGSRLQVKDSPGQHEIDLGWVEPSGEGSLD